MPLTVIGTDGGLLEAPVTRPFVMLAPGERVDLWADLRDVPLGTTVTLTSLAFAGAEGGAMPGVAGTPGSGGMGGMGGMSGMGASAAPSLGAALGILRIKVARQEAGTLTLPTVLSSVVRTQREQAVNQTTPRPVALSFRGMQWLINGKSFEMDVVAPEEIVKLNTLEVWEIINQTNPGAVLDAMGMAHPIHIHGGQFQVIGRSVLRW